MELRVASGEDLRARPLQSECGGRHGRCISGPVTRAGVPGLQRAELRPIGCEGEPPRRWGCRGAGSQRPRRRHRRDLRRPETSPRPQPWAPHPRQAALQRVRCGWGGARVRKCEGAPLLPCAALRASRMALAPRSRALRGFSRDGKRPSLSGVKRRKHAAKLLDLLSLGRGRGPKAGRRRQSLARRRAGGGPVRPGSGRARRGGHARACAGGVARRPRPRRRCVWRAGGGCAVWQLLLAAGR